MGKKLALLGLVVGAFSCGGGDLSAPEWGWDSSSYVRINSVDIGTNELSVGSVLTLNWSVSYSSPANLYAVEVYISPSQEVPADDAGTYRLLYRGCGDVSIFPCGSLGSATCYYNQKLNEYAVFDCETFVERIPVIGDGYLIFKACIYDENLDYVCDERVFSVKVY